MNKLPNKVLCAALLLAVTVVMWFLNHFTPLFLDDWHYAFIFGTLEPIRSVGDILVSQWHHYLSFNGRFVAHFFVQFFDGSKCAKNHVVHRFGRYAGEGFLPAPLGI